MPKMTICSDLDAIGPRDWDSLLENCPDSTVFQSRAWIRNWWNAFADGQRRLHVIAAWEDTRLVGLAPLYRQSQRRLGLPASELRFLGSDQSDYNVFPVWNGSPAIVRLLLTAVQDSVQSNVAAVLEEIPQFSTLAVCLREQVVSGTEGLSVTATTVCPRLRIRDNAAKVAAILKKDSLKRHFKALTNAVGPIEVRHSGDAAEISPLLPELFRQHIERWSATPHPSMFLDPRNQRFYEGLTRDLAASDSLVFTTVSAGGRNVAMHFGLRSRDEFIWYKPTFNVEFQKHAPGEVLLRSLIEYAQREGYASLDFSRGDERFKSRFASGADYNASFEWLPQHFSRRLLQWARIRRRALRERIRQLKERPAALQQPASPPTPRVLLLGLRIEGADRIVGSGLANGVEIELAHGDPRIDSAAPQHTLPDTADATVFAKWLQALNAERKYSLFLAIDLQTQAALCRVNDSSLRAKALAPRIDLLDESALLHAIRSACAALGLEVDAGNQQPAERDCIRVACLYDEGRMGWYCVESAAAMPGTEAVLLGRRMLDSLRWHGLATLDFVVNAAGKLALRRMTPFAARELMTEIAADRDLLCSAILLAGGERIRPQPPPRPRHARPARRPNEYSTSQGTLS
jgi:CelD/BcsL family acetyltransferase involved in cellulose biosynthesis